MLIIKNILSADNPTTGQQRRGKRPVGGGMGIEMIMGIVITILAAIVGAFGLGKSRGTSIAETKADQQRTEERVQQTVNHLPDDDVNRELRLNWTRKG